MDIIRIPLLILLLVLALARRRQKSMQEPRPEGAGEDQRRTRAAAIVVAVLLTGVALAAVASRIPGLDLGFLRLLAIFLSFDLLTYIAMKAGWIRTPAQRSGLEK